jgi:hypothetical protein
MFCSQSTSGAVDRGEGAEDEGDPPGQRRHPRPGRQQARDAERQDHEAVEGGQVVVQRIAQEGVGEAVERDPADEHGEDRALDRDGRDDEREQRGHQVRRPARLGGAGADEQRSGDRADADQRTARQPAPDQGWRVAARRDGGAQLGHQGSIGSCQACL